jgi:hypothetical protein
MHHREIEKRELPAKLELHLKESSKMKEKRSPELLPGRMPSKAFIFTKILKLLTVNQEI